MSSFPALFQALALRGECRVPGGAAAQTVLYVSWNRFHTLRQRPRGFVPSRATRLWRGRCGRKVEVGVSWADVQLSTTHNGVTLRQRRLRQRIDRSGVKEVAGRSTVQLWKGKVSIESVET